MKNLKKIKFKAPAIDLEIKEKLKHWPKIISKYKIPSTKKAMIQLANTFLPFIGIWVLCYFSLDWSYWLTLGFAVLGGFFLARIFIIQHDCGHQSFLKSKKWNDILGFTSSFFTTLPYHYWSRVHSFHHGHIGQLEHRDIGDIDFLTVEEFKQLNKWRRFKYRMFRSPLVLFGVVPVYYFTISNRIPTVSISKGWSEVSKSQVVNNVAVGLVYLLLALILGWKQFLLVHIPIVAAFSIISFWFFYVQHQHEKTYMQWRDNWDYLLASIKGASYYKVPKVFRWLTGNISFHHIHHLSSRIPNYNLEDCARENPILQKYVTSVSFSESLKLIRHKLWDEESQRMISFREFYKRLNGNNKS